MNNFKSIIRNALKNKGITFLNVLGLTVGFVCSIFLILWVVHETNYDSFIKDKETTYRVILKNCGGDKQTRTASSMNGVGPEAAKLFPEVENYTRIHQSNPNTIVKTLDRKFFRVTGYFADSTFFDLLPYPVVEGKLSNALGVRNSIVIEKQLAIKCFGNNSAMGKQLVIDDQQFTVSAVIDNIPSNSHLQFQYLIPTLNILSNWHNDLWGSDNSITYLKLKPHVNTELLNKKITDLVYANNDGWKDIHVKVELQNLKEIPFSTHFSWDNAHKSSKQNIYALSGIAFLILLIACINFTNLFISSALNRKKALGVKLASGASRLSIIKEYITEVFLYVSVSFVCAVIVLLLLSPYLNYLSESIIDFNFLSFRFIIIGALLILLTASLAGAFPGTYFSRFKLTEILKNKISTSGNNTSIQNGMLTAQFVIAIVLVFAVITIHKQVNFLQSKNLGFDKENVLYVHTTGKLKNELHQQKLKDELTKNPNITAIAYRGGVPTIWTNGMPISATPDNKHSVSSEEIYVGQDYFDLVKVDFNEGNNVFSDKHTPYNHCIINKKAGELLNLTPPYIYQVIYKNGSNQPLVIKGVIENINTKSLTQEVIPNVYFRYNDKKQSSYQNGILLFKVAKSHSSAIADIQAYWEKEYPNTPFEYWFLDQTYDNLYKSERKAREILSWLTLIALVLTSLGLLAMSYFISQQRTKEIGIRKVNGAKITEILSMLNRDFIKWVAIAFVLACPIAWYAMNKWLENFAYKTSLSWWIFVLAGVLALAIALLTVSFQSYKAATRNPVEALRYE